MINSSNDAVAALPHTDVSQPMVPPEHGALWHNSILQRGDARAQLNLGCAGLHVFAADSASDWIAEAWLYLPSRQHAGHSVDLGHWAPESTRVQHHSIASCMSSD